MKRATAMNGLIFKNKKPINMAHTTNRIDQEK